LNEFIEKYQLTHRRKKDSERSKRKKIMTSKIDSISSSQTETASFITIIVSTSNVISISIVSISTVSISIVSISIVSILIVFFASIVSSISTVFSIAIALLISTVSQNSYVSQSQLASFVDYVDFYLSHQHIMNFDHSLNLNYQMFFEYYFFNSVMISSNFSIQNMINMNDKIVVLQTTIDQFQARVNNIFDLNERITIRMSDLNKKINWIKIFFLYVRVAFLFDW
jgi:hypothetical protein